MTEEEDGARPDVPITPVLFLLLPKLAQIIRLLGFLHNRNQKKNFFVYGALCVE